MTTTIVLLAAFAGLALLFRAVEGRWPGRERAGDAALWALNAACILLFAHAVAVARAKWPGVEWLTIAPLHETLIAAPVWAQSLALLVAGEFTSYWAHRLVEHGPLWKYHAIHHSSPRFDWLTANVIHPVNGVSHFLAETVVPSLLLGLEPTFWVILTRVGVATFSHADVDWDFGPLRHVLASPAYHRRHHTPEEGGHQTNFGVLTPVFDRLFGTCRMPGAPPRLYGLPEEGVPTTFWGRLSWPLRRAPGDA